VSTTSRPTSGSRQPIGSLSTSVKSSHPSCQKQKDPVRSRDLVVDRRASLSLSFAGDASNFDDYEEEPRKEPARTVTLAHARLALLVRIATTEKFGKEFEEF
jgi:hypothetical protein